MAAFDLLSFGGDFRDARIVEPFAIPPVPFDDARVTRLGGDYEILLLKWATNVETMTPELQVVGRPVCSVPTFHRLLGREAARCIGIKLKPIRIIEH